MHRTVLLAFWLAASCTAQAPQPEPVDPTSTGSEPEPKDQPKAAAGQVLGVMQSFEGLTLQLESGGCRKHADVSFDVVDGKLSIAPLIPDPCEAELVLGETLLFPWAELPAFSALNFRLAPAIVVEPGSSPGVTKAPAGAIDETIYGVLVTPDGVDVRVFSGGCTGVEDFTAWIEPGETELVHLVRTRIDGCEAYQPEGALLHFTWTQLGVTKGSARVVNPIDKLMLEN